MTDTVARESEKFASADASADEAQRWLAEQFAAQARAGHPAGLAPNQQSELSNLLSIAWWDSALVGAEDAGDPDAADAATMIGSVLPAAVHAAAHFEDGSPVLALFLRNVVNAAWALAWDHTLLTSVVESACDAAAEIGDEDASGAAGPLGWRLLRFMLREFAVETAVLTGRLETVVRISQAAVEEIAPIVDAVRALPPSPRRTALLRESDNESVYYRSVHDIAEVSLSLLSRSTEDASVRIDEVRARIEATPFNSMDASELRGHLAAAEVIQAASLRDWVHVDEGRLRIVYPFGIRTTGSTAAKEVIEAVRAGADGLRRSGTPFAGVPILEVLERLDLSDAWQGTDAFGRAYQGITVRLDDLELRHPSAAEPLEVIHPRIQLSQLGNHVIVFEIDLEDAPAYRVAEAVNLATPVFGDLREISDELGMSPSRGGEPISRLADLVRAILAEIRGILERTSVGGDAVAAREGSFGIMVTLERASRVKGAVATPLASARDLLSLWGVQPLIHPLPSGAASVADWAMYDTEQVEQFPLLHLNDELLAANANVTLLASFRSPRYAISDIESYVEFAHSMHGMYQGWQDTVRDHAEEIASLLGAVESALSRADEADNDAESVKALGELVRRIERAELALQAFVQSNEAVILFIDSPSIVTSPPLRTDLDRVLRSNRYAALREGFERAARDILGSRLQQLLDVVHRRMEQASERTRLELERRAQEEREKAAEEEAQRRSRFERAVTLVGLGITTVGVSGLASLLQAGFDWEGPNTWWLVVGIVVVSLAVALVFLGWAASISRKPGARPPRRARRDSSDGRGS